MLVWISSPVLSKKPVLIKITLSLATSIHSFKLTVVLLSSSIIPTFADKWGMFRAFSTAANKSHVSWTSSGPCIFGFTIYMLPVLEFLYRPLFSRSCLAIHMVNIASMMPSGTSAPVESNIPGFVIRWPTFLTSIKLLPGNVISEPSLALYGLSGFSSLVICEPFLLKDSCKFPFIRPSQFL